MCQTITQETNTSPQSSLYAHSGSLANAAIDTVIQACIVEWIMAEHVALYDDSCIMRLCYNILAAPQKT
jgi:hypothetical protein